MDSKYVQHVLHVTSLILKDTDDVSFVRVCTNFLRPCLSFTQSLTSVTFFDFPHNSTIQLCTTTLISYKICVLIFNISFNPHLYIQCRPHIKKSLLLRHIFSVCCPIYSLYLFHYIFLFVFFLICLAPMYSLSLVSFIKNAVLN